MSTSPETTRPSVTAPLPAETGPTAGPAAGRTAGGRFAKNNKGGPGNPFNRQVAALRRALLNAVTAGDLQEIAAILLIKAKSGDLAAIKLLLSYTIGKPGPAVEPDTLDQQEWEMHQRAAVPPQQVDDLMTSVPAASANAVAQIAWPCAAQQQMQPVVDGLRAAEAAAGANPASGPSTQEQAGAASDSPAAQPSQDRTEPPSPNRGNGGHRKPRPAERTPRSSRPATPRPADLPDHIDWEYEERIMDILFGDDDAPPDTKPR